eukprot:3144279-Amphidinium_carterae.2
MCSEHTNIALSKKTLNACSKAHRCRIACVLAIYLALIPPMRDWSHADLDADLFASGSQSASQPVNHTNDKGSHQAAQKHSFTRLTTSV